MLNLPPDRAMILSVVARWRYDYSNQGDGFPKGLAPTVPALSPQALGPPGSQPGAHLQCRCLGSVCTEPRATLHANPSARCGLRTRFELVCTGTSAVHTGGRVGRAGPPRHAALCWRGVRKGTPSAPLPRGAPHPLRAEARFPPHSRGFGPRTSSSALEDAVWAMLGRDSDAKACIFKICENVVGLFDWGKRKFSL